MWQAGLDVLGPAGRQRHVRNSPNRPPRIQPPAGPLGICYTIEVPDRRCRVAAPFLGHPDRRPAASATAGPVPPSSDALPAARVALPHNLPSTLPRSRLSLARLNPKHGGGPDDSLCPP